MKIYYIIPPNYRLTGYPQNFEIKLYYFQERLSPQFNIIPKLLSVSYMFLVKKLISKKTYFLKSIPFLYFIFHIIYHSVCDQIVPYLN